jgi:hypothetical protein
LPGLTTEAAKREEILENVTKRAKNILKASKSSEAGILQPYDRIGRTGVSFADRAKPHGFQRLP